MGALRRGQRRVCVLDRRTAECHSPASPAKAGASGLANLHTLPYIDRARSCNRAPRPPPGHLAQAGTTPARPPSSRGRETYVLHASRLALGAGEAVHARGPRTCSGAPRLARRRERASAAAARCSRLFASLPGREGCDWPPRCRSRPRRAGGAARAARASLSRGACGAACRHGSARPLTPARPPTVFGLSPARVALSRAQDGKVHV
jgi:hypothetical protein